MGAIVHQGRFSTHVWESTRVPIACSTLLCRGSSIAVSLSIPKLFARMMFAPSAQYFSSSFSRLITSRASAPEMESSNPK